MSFLVYLFVLLVAAGSVIFGLDWTQAPLNPPPYATPPAQTTAAKPVPTPVPAPVATAQNSVRSPTSAKPTTAAAASGAAAMASATHEDAATTGSTEAQPAQQAAAHCNIPVCSAAYKSFRASDCTYQPYNGPRRLCSRTSAGRLATATHARSARRNEEPRISDRRDYGDRRDDGDRGGWNFDFFGDTAYDR